MLYGWLVDEQMTIRQMLKRLNAGPYLRAQAAIRGHLRWCITSSSDPIYAGTAYANRYDLCASKKAAARLRRSAAREPRRCRRLKPREQWIAIPVPALIDTEIWDRAQAQLARNATLSFRNNSKYNYLLRCLLTCEACGLAMFGLLPGPANGAPARNGSITMCSRQGLHPDARRTSVCTSRSHQGRGNRAAVWEHVAGLLAEPAATAGPIRPPRRHGKAGSATRPSCGAAIHDHGWSASRVPTRVCSTPIRLRRSAWRS